MKNYTRFVHANSLVGSSGYSTGILEVGDLEYLMISTNVTSGSTAFAISVCDYNGHLYKVAQFNSPGSGLVVIGNSSIYVLNSGVTNAGIPFFGDQVQIDQTGGIADFDLSVKGK